MLRRIHRKEVIKERAVTQSDLDCLVSLERSNKMHFSIAESEAIQLGTRVVGHTIEWGDYSGKQRL